MPDLFWTGVGYLILFGVGFTWLDNLFGRPFLWWTRSQPHLVMAVVGVLILTFFARQ